MAIWETFPLFLWALTTKLQRSNLLTGYQLTATSCFWNFVITMKTSHHLQRTPQLLIKTWQNYVHFRYPKTESRSHFGYPKTEPKISNLKKNQNHKWSLAVLYSLQRGMTSSGRPAQGWWFSEEWTILQSWCNYLW